MKIGLSFLLLTFFGSLGRAESAVERNTPQEIATSAIPGESRASGTFVSAGPGLAIYGGNMGWALNVGFLNQLGGEPNLFWGVDVGFNFWNFETPAVPGIGRVDTGATGIGFRPGILYRVQVPGPLFPYIGLTVGPHVYVASARVSNAGASRDESSTDVYFEALLRPGFYVRLSETVALQVDGRLGVLRSSFAFFPSANAILSL